MNMQNLMMQAQKMKKDMEKAQSEIMSKEYVGNSQFVDVTMKGDYSLVSVNLKLENDFSSDDKEILEDMILLAVNDAVSKIDKEKEEKFGKYGQAFNGLM